MIRVPTPYGPPDRCIPASALAAHGHAVRISDLPAHLRPIRAPVLPPRPPTPMEVALSRPFPTNLRQALYGCPSCPRSTK
ncbi:hypothetical protein ACQVP2_28310 [Methylobacterium aquaticum]|uniref:hypothetical protein n=1 Tax=Methylobacterium aquaticum TaxID=270351 RepID=UPI003D173A09